MKEHWQRVASKIDALSLRERTIVFAMAALILVVLVNTALLEPQYARQKQLSQRIKQEQSVLGGVQAEIQQKAMSLDADPDRATRAKLQQLKDQSTELQLALADLQKGLVSPDKMSALLEDILKKNGSLRLVSLKTLPATSLLGSLPKAASPTDAVKHEETASSTAANAIHKSVAGSVYKHGVELVLQGSYLDTMDYLSQLEAMPWQLFWSQANLQVDEYPKTTLTLTLFTLSQNAKWLNL